MSLNFDMVMPVGALRINVDVNDGVEIAQTSFFHIVCAENKHHSVKLRNKLGNVSQLWGDVSSSHVPKDKINKEKVGYAVNRQEQPIPVFLWNESYAWWCEDSPIS